MDDPIDDIEVQGGLSEHEKRQNVVRCAFGGQVEAFETFCQTLHDFVPPGTRVIVRGSAVTGRRWRDDLPFDADGPGTSDLDVTMVGDAGLAYFVTTGYFVPGVHTRPLSDDDPDIAPDLVPLRQRLMAMVGRPVNIQASRDIVTRFRGDLLGQPYLTLFVKPEGLAIAGAASEA